MSVKQIKLTGQAIKDIHHYIEQLKIDTKVLHQYANAIENWVALIEELLQGD